MRRAGVRAGTVVRFTFVPSSENAEEGLRLNWRGVRPAGKILGIARLRLPATTDRL